MTKKQKFLSKKKRPSGEGTKRALNMGGDVNLSPQQEAIMQMGRRDLLALVAALQSQNMALHGELSIQHEKSNQALRMLGSAYQFLFGITFSYIEALRNFKEAGNDKPIPAMWLAARICENFEAYFEKHDVSELDIGPNRDLLRHMYDIAGRKLNPGSKVATYCGIPAPEQGPAPAPEPEPQALEKKGAARGKKK